MIRQGGPEERFTFDVVRKKFSTQRIVGHWKRLSKQILCAPFLGVFKARLDRALHSLIWWVTYLCVAGGLELNGII